MTPKPPLWRCPKCRRKFANRNQSHACGMLPEKTRIAFQVRMSFAQVTPRMRWLDGHVVLARRYEHPRFRRVETYSPRNHLHAFRVMSSDDLDHEFVAWLREAYAVGEQRHLQRPASDGV